MSLNELDTIDWYSLEHAHGSAEDVPELLHALARGDEDRLGMLYETIWHQGTIYTASAAALPFLFEIAKSTVEKPITADKEYQPTPAEHAVCLICSIATGEGWHQYALRHSSAESLEKILAARGKSIPSETEREKLVLDSIQATVKRSLTLLLPFAGAPEGLGELVEETLAIYS